MTILKGSALALVIAGAFALGVWVSPRVGHDLTNTAGTPSAAIAAPTSAQPSPAASPAGARPAWAAVPPTAPPLVDRLKPLMRPGTKMDLAAEGVKTAEQFATLAHASHNLDVTYVLLKDKVVRQHMSLAAAIHVMKPTADAPVEAELARAQAKEDLATVTGI